jgi:hypothetical protein
MPRSDREGSYLASPAASRRTSPDPEDWATRRTEFDLVTGAYTPIVLQSNIFRGLTVRIGRDLVAPCRH